MAITNTQSTCAVSVIIPMYNAEKYVGVCLESIFIQTLQDFEVIVVDDCSTDSSAAIAESLLEKFGGRLKIIALTENTGSAAVPRNVGLEYARGKYVYFVDNDDLLIDSALETLYNFAEEYQADVVSMMSGFICSEEPFPKKVVERKWLPASKKEMILGVEDFEQRLKFFYSSQYEFVPWSRFLRREYLIENKITFPAIKISDDVVWNLKLIFTANKWLRIDVPLYIQRHVPNSNSRQKRSPEQIIRFYASPLFGGVECLDSFMRTNDYLKKNPALHFQILDFFLNTRFDKISDALKQVSPLKVYEIFFSEFAESSHPALISYLLLMANIYRNKLRSLK